MADMADTLKNDYLETLRDYFCQLYRDQILCDVSFITKNGTTILAHKLIMAAFSGAVRAEVERWKDLPQVSIVVDCEDRVLRGIIEFIYTGTLNIDGELLPLVTDACHGLQIPLLLKHIEETTKDQKEADKVKNYVVLKNGENITIEVEKKGESGSAVNVKELDKTRKDKPCPRSKRSIKQKNANKEENFDWLVDENDEKSKDKPCPRSKRNIPLKNANKEEDFDWLDDEEDDIVDDTTDDETWQPCEKIDDDESDEDDKKGNKNSKLMKNAVVRLERIDFSPEFKKSKKFWNQINIDKDFTKLRQTEELKNRKKYPKFSVKSLPRQILRKMKHTVKLFKKKQLLRITAKKIIKNCKRISCIEKQKLGYSCRLCGFWAKSYPQCLVHVLHHCKYLSSKKNLKSKSTCKRKLSLSNNNSNSISKQERKRRKKRIERIKEKIQNLQCFKCPKKFKSIRSLTVHLREKHGYSAEKAQKLTGYPKYFVSAGKMNLVCNDCSMKFDKLIDFRDHCRVVHKKKRLDADIPCPQDGCEKKFFLHQNLKEHLSQDHQKDCTNLRFRDKDIDKIGGYLKRQDQILADFPAIEQKTHKNRRSSRLLNTNKGPNNKKPALTTLKSRYFKRNNQKYKVFIPTSTYKCHECVDEIKFHCRHSLSCHIEVAHHKQFISSQFWGRLALSKSMSYRNPSGCVLLGSATPKEGHHSSSNQTSKKHTDQATLNQNIEKVRDQSQLFQITEKVRDQSELMIQIAEKVRDQSELMIQIAEKVRDQSELETSSCMLNQSDSYHLGTEGETEKEVASDQFHGLDALSENLHGTNRNAENSRDNILVPQSEESSIDTHLTPVEVICDLTLDHTPVSTELFQLSRSHEKHKHTLFPFTCRKCGTSFHYFSLLTKHFDRKHKKFQMKQRSIFRNIRNYSNTRKAVYLRQKKNTSHEKTVFTPEMRKVDCSICGKTFTEARGLATHLKCYHRFSFEEVREQSGYPLYTMKDIVGPKTVKCIVCANSFTQLRTLASHLQTIHQYSFEEAREATGYPSFRNKTIPPSKMSCQECSKSLPSKKALTRHMKKEHGTACPYCKESFSSKLSLKRHGLKYHPDKLEVFQHMRLKPLDDDETLEKKALQCESCDFTATSFKLLRTHVIDNHPDVLHSCHLCSFSFRHKKLLDRHIENFHGEAEKDKKECRVCKQKFVQICYLRVHEFKKHGIPHRSLKEYHCDFEGCNKVFYTKYNIHAHKRNHKIERKHACPQCEYVGKTKTTLRRHINGVHEQIKPHLCDTCGKEFKEETHLRNHIKRFHTEDFLTLQCEYCVYQCGLKPDLHTHIFHQHGIKSADDKRIYLKCDQCPYETPLKGKFKDHVNGHNNVRNYVCEVCNQTFVTRSTLTTHMKWKHSKSEKQCPHCNYVTKTQPRLNEHIRIQHELKGVKPYRCVYCSFTCATSGNCRKHIMGKHKGQEVKYTYDKEYLENSKKALKAGNTKPLVVIETKPEIDEVVDPILDQYY